jgi:hypothetical protein
LGLVQEAADGFVAAIFVGRQREQLDGHDLAELQVTSRKDHAHAATTHQAFDAVLVGQHLAHGGNARSVALCCLPRHHPKSLSNERA